MAPTRLETDVREHGEWVMVVLDGEVDMASAPRLQEVLAAQLAAGARQVMVDLREVSFMDSTGLTALFRAHEAMAAAGGRLVVVCGPGPVRRVIEVSGVGAVVPILSDPAETAA